VSFYLRSDTGSCAARQWVESSRPPGNQIVVLRSVRVRDVAGDTRETVDVRNPVGIEMEYEVRQPGYILVPNFNVHDDEGVCLFTVHELDPAWRRKPKAPGVYATTAWVPGDLLAEGTHFVGAGISTMVPLYTHFYESDAVAFHVVDSCQGDSARGDFNGDMPGIVRPLLEWSTRFLGPAAGPHAEMVPSDEVTMS
jgi:lipopolysaccharide transport system ATP-binding protein